MALPTHIPAHSVAKRNPAHKERALGAHIIDTLDTSVRRDEQLKKYTVKDRNNEIYIKLA